MLLSSPLTSAYQEYTLAVAYPDLQLFRVRLDSIVANHLSEKFSSFDEESSFSRIELHLIMTKDKEDLF